MAKDTTTKSFSEKQEKMVATVLSGKVVAASGARMDPGDVSTVEWLAECKTHTTPGHNIFFDLSVWKKICDEAMARHRKPVLIVDDGSQKEKNTWCLCRAINLNQTNLLNVDFPNAIRKNITGDGAKMLKDLAAITKRYVGEFYIGGAYTAIWGDEEVVIMPLTLFKEVIDK